MTELCKPPAPVVPPRLPLPPGACDCHAHVFGPSSTFAYAAGRSYTPPDAPLASYIDMLDTLGFERGVLVQGSAHGLDNGAMLDALEHHRSRLRGICVASSASADAFPAWHERGVRGLRFNHFFRGGKLHYQAGVGLEEAKALAPVLADLGWHIQLWIDVKDLPAIAADLRRLPVPVVIDHMGRTEAAAGSGSEGFQSLLRLVGEGVCWVKLSGAHRLSDDHPDYPSVRPFHEALVRANPDHLVWGTDWPHPRIEATMPGAGHLLDLFQDWTPDAGVRRRILVDNPARLYDFDTKA